MAKRRLYVIGDKQTGVAFVTLDPLRAAIVTAGDLNRFADEKGLSVDAVLGQIAKSVQNLIVKNVDPEDLPNDAVVGETIGKLIARGSSVSDAEFCLIADLDGGSDWETYRNPFPPIEPSLNHLAVSTPGYEAKAYPSPLMDDGPGPARVRAAKAKPRKAAKRKR